MKRFLLGVAFLIVVFVGGMLFAANAVPPTLTFDDIRIPDETLTRVAREQATWQAQHPLTDATMTVRARQTIFDTQEAAATAGTLYRQLDATAESLQATVAAMSATSIPKNETQQHREQKTDRDALVDMAATLAATGNRESRESGK